MLGQKMKIFCLPKSFFVILEKAVRSFKHLKKWGSYYINGYAVLFAIETGVRVGELCALKWSDITENSIHIHAQQLDTKENGKKVP